MHRYSRTHLSDVTLVRSLHDHVAQERATTAELLADLGEVDARRLYAPAGYPSMFAFCTGELRLSEESACRRISAARTARSFPVVFELVADGRLNLTAVVLLAPHLAPGNASELLAAATHLGRTEIQQLLAERFPRLDVPEQVAPLALDSPSPVTVNGTKHACAAMGSAPAFVSDSARGDVAPLAPERFAIQLTVSRATHEKLVHAQELLGHATPSSALADLFDRALDALIAQLERRCRAATPRPRRSARASASPRHVPAAVRRAVWARDGDRCTFVSDGGHRCEARTHLELDHVEPVARGGRSTAGNLRLRCRAHNQLAADQAFGAGFMSRKRCAPEGANARACAEAAVAPPRAEVAAATESRARALPGRTSCKSAAGHDTADHVSAEHDSPVTPTPGDAEHTVTEARAQAMEIARAATEAARQSAAAEEAHRHAAVEEARCRAAAEEVVPYLRRLGLRLAAAREAARGCGADPGAPLEQRIRQALVFYGRLRYPGARPQSAA